MIPGGASGRVTLQQAARLGRRAYVCQEKHDGVMAHVVCDTAGRARHFFYRSGAAIPDSLTTGIKGEVVGYPHAEFLAELEALTEASVRLVAARGGIRLAHIWDLAHDGTRSLVAEPYRVRRAALQAMRADIELNGPRRSWERDRSGRAHGKGSGRFVAPSPEGWRRMPITTDWPIAQLEDVWGRLVDGGDAEGLVIRAVDAPIGKRGAARKLKRAEFTDLVVASVSRTVVTCHYAGSYISLGRGRHDVRVGDVVEVRSNGEYETQRVLRFPALVRVREDMRGAP